MLRKIFRFLKNTVILFLVASIGFVSGIYVFEGFFATDLIHPILYRVFGDKTYFTSLVLREKLYSPEKISKWLIQNIEYKSDEELYNKIEYWQTPLETISKKAGDCEDFAFLTQELLNQIGIFSEVVMMEDFYFEGHAICICKWRDSYYIFDNGYLWIDNKKLNSIEELLFYYYGIPYKYWRFK